MSKKKLITWMIVIFLVLGVGGSFGSILIGQNIQQNQAQQHLDEMIAQRGQLAAKNTNVVNFTGKNVPGATKNQKALSDGKNTDTFFEFWNGKKVNNRSTVDIYLDLADQRSRDFFNFNNAFLKNSVESGRITLRIHPVINKDPFSAYSAESIALSFASSPDLSWNSLVQLSKDGPNLSGISSDESAKKTSEALRTVGISFTPENIKSGVFSSWIFQGLEDPRVLSADVLLPMVFVDGKRLNLQPEEFNEVEVFAKKLQENLKS